MQAADGSEAFPSAQRFIEWGARPPGFCGRSREYFELCGERKPAEWYRTRSFVREQGRRFSPGAADARQLRFPFAKEPTLPLVLLRPGKQTRCDEHFLSLIHISEPTRLL